MQSSGVPVYTQGWWGITQKCSLTSAAHKIMLTGMFTFAFSYWKVNILYFHILLWWHDRFMNNFYYQFLSTSDELRKSFYHRLRHFFNMKANRNYFDTVECNKAICDQFEWDEWKRKQSLALGVSASRFDIFSNTAEASWVTSPPPRLFTHHLSML